MRPILETIDLDEDRRSLLVFARHEERFAPYWHYHPEVELTLITKGRGTRFVGDHIGAYAQGDLVLLGRDLPHQWISSDRTLSPENSAVVLQFRENLFSPYPECQPVANLLLLARRGLSFQNTSTSLKERVQEISSLDPGRQLSSLLGVLFDLASFTEMNVLSKQASFSNRRRDEAKINGILNHILENINQPLSVTEIAERANLVPQSFCRWFKQNTGQSYIKFLNKVRLEHACEMLLTADLPVHDIALQSGFDNVSHFNRTFKSNLGMTPSKYRQGREFITPPV